MTQTLQQRPGRGEQGTHIVEASPPPHPHWTLGILVTLGILGTILAVGVAIVALTATANRNSVDDALVSDKVEAFLAEASASDSTVEVIPAIVPMSELSTVPGGEVNVATGPNLPAPSGRTEPAIVEVSFEVVEGVNVIDGDGTETETWGYQVLDGEDGIVAGTPGPVIRARVGDVLRFTITNPAENSHPHNVDLHAVTGQGGGAEDTTVAPGETKTIEARLLYPGFFMYHCAYGDVPAHISHGMFGGILVDPADPLPQVDHEWYIVQSEYYTSGARGGMVEFDRAAVTDEDPSFVVFNGAEGALTGDNALEMSVGERARIYFINAGLNLTSNLHPIGSHWDAVYQEAALLNPPLRGSQTTLIPAGGGTVVELVGRVPSTVIFVDHALARAFDKGAVGEIVISGDEQPEIFRAVEAEDGADRLSETTVATSAGETVSIAAGAGDVQPMDAPDEFAENESPGDYSVNLLTIPAGTTVTWTNDDTMMHTVTDVNGAFDSGFLEEGDTWSYTFEEPGEYEYFCSPHPWMRAKVIVE